MGSYKFSPRRSLVVGGIFIVTVAGGRGLAADDPSIPGEIRERAKSAMEEFVVERAKDGFLYHYDPVQGKLLKLRLKEIHSGLVKKGDFYVSCADFIDSTGRVYDLDFLVLRKGETMRANQVIVHAVEGKKRPYHVESP